MSKIPHPVLTIGTFDGVHLGHQKIIKQLNEVAAKNGGESVLFTFYPHPRMVLFPDAHGLKLIQTQEEKLDKLERMGLKNIIVHPFTKEFSRLTAIEFVRDFLINQLNIKTIVIGYDHQFGKNREGSIELLKDLAPVYDFEVIEIGAKDIDEVNVSSTKIRKALKEGDIELANTYLGEEFQINGKVVRGEQLGTKLGFPTANIDVENEIKSIPKNGVYATRVILENGNSHFGLVNIGERPTVDDSGKTTIEVYILDFEGDLYGSKLQLKMLKRLRDEKKFNTIEELKTEMKNDEKCLRNWINDFNW
ncbi:bifunctional riboflavin kinase/FAD synthetase [Brumimicrobium aurantiacum]|uniref:Riboflavin biosynthesis protein n=1 Tax=Brumimicrobium aurantiacum TaxID=1737063 RepID=A0A3E1EUX9_9FLAO|nr:bifunctional riboflavin kinase/FAD synthetase [Brumimicrobium aurantiacum]RFC53312.1 bifunctional riboflavin kinase/FAD synthetase [Brumimicrobium aurantiacum]